MISGTLDYNPLEDITTILSAKDSLNDIDKLIDATRNYKLGLESEIQHDRESEEHVEEQVEEEEFDFNKIFERIEETKSFACSTQSNISQLTEGISHLDNAKRNLTQCMTLFQNLKIMTDSYVQSKTLLATESYKEASASFKIMCSLAESNFKPYKSVDEINKLLTAISRLRLDTFDGIKRNYGKALIGKIPEGDILEDQLRVGASDLLDSDLSGRSQTIDWCINKMLYEIGEIFRIDDEAGSLENLSRRYIFFKKVLNNYNTSFARFFPEEWDMPLKLTSRFYELTRKDLQNLLKRELENSDPSIDLFMSALQTTLDFEKYIDIRFSKKLDQTNLSSCFEPYLSLWISHQDKMMNEKMLSYMSGSTLDPNSSSLVIPSSADLFRTYRSVLSQTFELIDNKTDEKILLALANFFAKWLMTYSKKILSPLLLPENVEIQDKEETIKYTVALINTADYCSTTIDQLEEKLKDFGPESEKIEQAFAFVKDTYGELTSGGTNLLLNRVLQLDLTFVWKEFYNTDWMHVVVEDYSRYMVTLKSVLCFADPHRSSSEKAGLELILTQFNREVYSWNFLDKVIEQITQSYLGHIVRLLQRAVPYGNPATPRNFDPKRVVSIGEQLLLDLELLKQTMLSLSESVAEVTNTTQSSAHKRARRHVETNIDSILRFLKLLVAPLDSSDDYFAIYKQLTNSNRNSSVWAFILSLKGIAWDLAVWKQHWTAFDFDSDEQGESDRTRDTFVFKWNLHQLHQFEINMARVPDASWAKFIRKDLNISPPSRTPSKTPSRTPSRQQVVQTDQPARPQPKSPVMNVKNFVAGARLFNRGGV